MIHSKIVPALITPCSKPGVIDYRALQRLSGYLVEQGVDGLFAVSSTGGMPLLDRPERLRLIETVRAAIPAETTVLAGVSGTGIGQVLNNIRDASAAGANCAIVMPPFFLKLSSTQMRDYALALADESELPLILYHHLRMPTPIEPETAFELSRHSNVVGLKETSGCTDRLHQLSEHFGGTHFRIYQGNEPLVLASLRAGGWGTITALANIAPALHHRIHDAFSDDRLPEAGQLQEQLTELWRIFKLPSVAQSFAHFVQTITIPLWKSGILNSPHTIFPGYEPDPTFVKEVSDFFKKWSASCEVRTGGAMQH